MQHQPLSHHTELRPHIPEDPTELPRDWLARFLNPKGSGLLLVSGILAIIGIVGFAMRIAGGTTHREEWVYYAATLMFLFSTASAAPILSIATRFTKGFWRKPLVRVAELYTLIGVLNLILLFPLLGTLPPLEGRFSFWMPYLDKWCLPGTSACIGPGTGMVTWAPAWPTVVMVLAMVICGLGLLYTSIRPDMAAVRDLAPGKRNGIQAMIAGEWGGSTKQWKILTNGLTYFGAFYLFAIVGVHYQFSVDFAISLVPGWRDPIFPAFHAISSFQAGLATLVLTLAFMRYAGGYKDYLALDQFWNPGKL